MNDIRALLQQSNVIPVLVIHHLDHALPLAEKLFSDGYQTLEITLRTPVALPALRAIKKTFPHLTVGVGTVLQAQQLNEAQAAGAEFAVSPGLTPRLCLQAQQFKLPFLPGVITPSEVMLACDLGFQTLKFFPAKLNGGPAALKNYQQLFPQIKFCPTGGITEQTAKDYLVLDNVIAVGGTWMI